MTTVPLKTQWNCLRSQVVRTGPRGQEQRILIQSCYCKTEQQPQSIVGFKTENVILRSEYEDLKIYINL